MATNLELKYIVDLFFPIILETLIKTQLKGNGNI